MKPATNYRQCARCGHEWIRKGDVEPKQCPKCRSEKWNVQQQLQEAQSGT